jgi:predicted nucleotidyltransferase
MATIADIIRISDSIVHEFNPRKIVFFGSYAWGKPSPDSDVDMLVILPFEGKSWQMAMAIREKVQVTFPLDLIVRTESQIEDRLHKHDSFISRIVEKGRVLHEG